eukprot:3060509-Lingulodinium_polyedra.AAC.1
MGPPKRRTPMWRPGLALCCAVAPASLLKPLWATLAGHSPQATGQTRGTVNTVATILLQATGGSKGGEPVMQVRLEKLWICAVGFETKLEAKERQSIMMIDGII